MVSNLNRKRRKRLHWTPPLDLGTVETRIHRIVATGRPDVPADFPLDVMLARRLITEDQARAGWRFARDRWLALGPPPGSVSEVYRRLIAELAWSAPAGDDRVAEAYARHKVSVIQMLQRAGDLATHEVMRACVYLERPRWLDDLIDTGRLTATALRAPEYLRRGLDVLARG